MSSDRRTLDRHTSDAARLAVFAESRVSGSRHDLGTLGVVGAEANKLLRIASLAEQFNSVQVKDDACSAAERIEGGRFYVACVGQFKRGKSTLLNALIGEPILPSGVVPVTAVPTILRFGESLGARVRLRSGEWTQIAIADIEEYVSEGRNPENSKGVAALEVFVPSPLLAGGMCLVDTPGLGSVFAGNTAATHAFLPHIDAAIVVIGADPPIAGDELALVESVAKEIPDILFVLNKADRVTEPERDAAISFARQVLAKRLPHPVSSIFEISALEQLDQGGPRRDWPQLLDALERLVRQSSRQLVRDAADRSLRRLSRQLLVVLKEERDALTRPFAESERRIRQLRETVSQAEQSLSDLGYLFSGEQQRLSKIFGDHRDIFLKSAQEVAHRELTLALKSLRRTSGPSYRRSAMGAAQDVARRHTLPWLESAETKGEEAYRKIAQRFTDLTTDFLSKTRGIGASELAYLPGELSAEQDFRTRSEFKFYDHSLLAKPVSPVRYAADLALGAIRAHALIDANAHDFLDLLLETNSERVRNDLEECVTKSRRFLEAEIRAMLRELSAVAERALARARTAQAAGAAAVESSLKNLAAMEVELARLGGSEASLREDS
ncbi:MAG: dynamin family protein [Terriglobales bacterium]